MKRIINTPAKINLALDVTGKRADGYHLLETVFQSISIYDTLEIELTDTGNIELSCSIPEIPCNEKNLVWKAAAAVMAETGTDKGFKIHLKKRIPSEAGMGGGSSDAAAALKGCNELLGEPVTFERLCEIGTMLGADVPFFLYGGTAYAEGIGERLIKLPSIPKLTLVAAKGAGGISTPEAYKRIDALTGLSHPDAKELKRTIEEGTSFHEMIPFCGNIFEDVTDLSDVDDIRRTMIDMGAVFSCMSGSGAAVFGVFEDINQAENCKAALSERYPFAVVCHTTED